jgi:hypothetical protein
MERWWQKMEREGKMWGKGVAVAVAVAVAVSAFRIFGGQFPMVLADWLA